MENGNNPNLLSVGGLETNYKDYSLSNRSASQASFSNNDELLLNKYM